MSADDVNGATDSTRKKRASRKGDREVRGGKSGGRKAAKAKATDNRARARDSKGRLVRLITMRHARVFADALVSDETHNIESASFAAGLVPSTVRDAIFRFRHDKCGSPQDHEVCGALARAHSEHIRRIRSHGLTAAKAGNRAGTSWAQWQSEIQDPINHPRKSAVELSGPEGGPIESDSKLSHGLTAEAAREMKLRFLGIRNKNDKDGAT